MVEDKRRRGKKKKYEMEVEREKETYEEGRKRIDEKGEELKGRTKKRREREEA